MKKLLSILLVLTMMLGLFGVAALADEEAEEVQIEKTAETPESEEEEASSALTILFTGKVGVPAIEETVESEETDIPEEGEEAEAAALSYAAAAALKEHYAQSGSVMLVDVGGFELSAVPVMEAAGYDLAVTGETIESETLVALAPVTDGPAGMMVNRDELILAFIGVDVPVLEQEETEEEPAEGEEETDPHAELYAAIQESVDKAAEADYVILIGLCEHAPALAEKISGVDAILTVGEGVETFEKEDETSVLIVGTGEAFGSVGVVTIGAEGIAAELLDAEAYAAIELTENEDITALEAAWIEQANAPEEQPEETQQPETPEQSETVMPTPAVTPETIPADGGEDETPADGGEDETPADGGEDETPADNGKDETPADNGEDETPADGGEDETPADNGKDETLTDEGEDEILTDGSEDETPAGDGEKTDPEPTPEADTSIQWSKGTEDLVIDFEDRVTGLKIGRNTLVEGSDYTVGEGGTTVSIAATMLNGWGNGRYEFLATYPDGTEASQIVSISGEAPEMPVQPETTVTPEPTKEPEEEKKPAEDSNWSKGTEDLKITFENRVSQLKVGGNTLVEGSDYTLTDEGNTAIVSAAMLNGWPNAKYAFTAVYADGSEKTAMVSISGEYNAPEAEVEEESEQLESAGATATPEPTKTPESSPNTGDTSPIVLYVVVFVVLLAALVVVLVMTGKKNKRR